MDHVHVFTDGHTGDYTVVPTTTFQIKTLSPGRHTIGVTLQHADHSPAGAKAQELLCYLLLHRDRPVLRTSLAALRNPRRARSTNLRSCAPSTCASPTAAAAKGPAEVQMSIGGGRIYTASEPTGSVSFASAAISL